MNIILLRGLVREKRHWGDFPERLKQHLPHVRILTPEIPGVGKFVDRVSPDTMDEMIHFMRKDIEPELRDSDNVIVAMSLGGMLAKRWSELYPQDFKQMILVNTSFAGITPLFKRLQPMTLLKFVKIFLTPTVEGREKSIVRLTSARKDKHHHVAKSWIEIQNDAPVSRKSFVNQIKAAMNFKPSKERPTPALTWLAAKGDRLCHYESSVRLQKLWGGNLKLHPTAGHDLSIDDPDWLIGEIKSAVITK